MGGVARPRYLLARAAVRPYPDRFGRPTKQPRDGFTQCLRRYKRPAADVSHMLLYILVTRRVQTPNSSLPPPVGAGRRGCRGVNRRVAAQ